MQNSDLEAPSTHYVIPAPSPTNIRITEWAKFVILDWTVVINNLHYFFDICSALLNQADVVTNMISSHTFVFCLFFFLPQILDFINTLWDPGYCVEVA